MKKTRKSKLSVLARSFVPVGIFILVISLLMVVVKADTPDPPAYNITSVYPSLPSDFNGGAVDQNDTYHNSRIWLPSSDLYPGDTYFYFARVLSGVQKTSADRGFPRADGVPGYTVDPSLIEKLYYWDFDETMFSRLISIDIFKYSFGEPFVSYEPTHFYLGTQTRLYDLGEGTLAVSRIDKSNGGNIRGVYNGHLTLVASVQSAYNDANELHRIVDLSFRMDYNGINSYLNIDFHFHSSPVTTADYFALESAYIRFGGSQAQTYQFSDYYNVYFMFGDTVAEDTVIPQYGLENFYPIFRAMRSNTAFYTYPAFYSSAFSSGFSDGQNSVDWTDSVAYNAGYNDGYNDGFANPASNSIANLIKEVIEAPFYIIAHGFNVDFMGINFANMIFFIISVAVGWFVIKLVTHLLL